MMPVKLLNGFVAVALATSIVSCAQLPASTSEAEEPQPVPMAAEACLGTTDLPTSMKDSFVPAVDAGLLAQAMGEPGKGGLCQGQVYISTGIKQVILHRAWNSTNPASQYGKWWAFSRPDGKVAQYREDYEICYQWSPLDKLVTCEIKAGTKVVVGNGQSAQCSQYLSYGVSASQQVFITDAANSVTNCRTYDAMMSWQ
ncbi:MAG: hypothetical protein VX474_02990 [Pseudomonadota bacterium]|nr:hypothetical protein [Pseudomonadota bacterium]MEE2748915.1 hypothetical protein [Pseudomonadota bacterium]